MNVYINAFANISPQHTFNEEGFLDPVIAHTHEYLKCVEPDYKAYIDPKSSRRMGRILKMGVMAANRCLDGSHVSIPDAIITGTGFGCLEDTENFLSRIIENNEQFLTPTSFIQSTHNTISAQIALLLNCHNYNFTYVHRGFSFESALIDAIMLIKENSAENALIGGIDEITPNFFTITKRLGQWKDEPMDNLNILSHKTPGSIAGEGSAFFLLSSLKTEKTTSRIAAVTTIYKPQHILEMQDGINNCLQQANLKIEDIDLLMLGLNGDINADQIYYDLQNSFFNNIDTVYFKHLCGEYQTASGFSLWLACKIISEQQVPAVIKLKEFKDKPLQNILIYNHYRTFNHSAMIVSKC